jgi:hypothetical protein
VASVRPEDPAAAPFAFVVRIRHPRAVADAAEQQAAFKGLLASLEAQSDPRFRLLIACHPTQALPPLPDFALRVDAEVPFDPAASDPSDEERRIAAVRQDKGLKLAAALGQVTPETQVMCVDDDDFVSRRLVEFVLGQDRDAAWVIDRGYGWTQGDSFVREIDNFHRLCGTSVIVPASWYKFLRGGFSQTEAILELGSHRIMVEEAEGPRRSFGRVPFRAAVYRRDHANAAQTGVRRAAAAAAARRPLGAKALEALRWVKGEIMPRPLTLTSGLRIGRRRIPIDDGFRREFFGAGRQAPACHAPVARRGAG